MIYRMDLEKKKSAFKVTGDSLQKSVFKILYMQCIWILEIVFVKSIHKKITLP